MRKSAAPTVPLNVENRPDGSTLVLIDANCKLKTIVMLKDYESRYGVLNFFSDEIKQAYIDMDFEIVEISTLHSDHLPQKLDHMLSAKSVLFVFLMNGIGLELPGVCSVLDKFEVPVFAFYVDHPMYHKERITAPLKNYLVSFISKEHIDYSRSQLGERIYTCFIPHGAINSRREEVEPLSQRPMGVLVAGSYTDYKAVQESWKRTLPTNIQALMNLTLERMIYSASLPLFQALANTIHDIGLSIQELDPHVIRMMMIYMDRFLRGMWREKALSFIQDVPVYVFGEGWENASLRDNVIVASSKPFPQLISFMAHSKIILDIHPYIHGAHERTFQAMREGAIVLTVDTPYIREQFGDTIFTFSLQKMNIQYQTERILEQIDVMNDIARFKIDYIKGKHLWFHRAQLILEHVRHFQESKGWVSSFFG